MILPLSGQGAGAGAGATAAAGAGAVKACVGMDLLANDGREASVRPAPARELKHSGEDCDAAGLGTLPKAASPWPLSVSEGSVSSSIDSLAAGESYSPSDFSSSIFSKGRSGLNMPDSLLLSDDDIAPDRVEEALGGANSRRRLEDLTPAGGDSVETSLCNDEYFAKMPDDGAGFHSGSTLSFPTSEGSSDATEQLLELDVGSKRKAPGRGGKLVDDHSDAESVSNAVSSVGLGPVAPDHTLAASEDLPCSRVKFMCSYGGKILPRPSVGDLRYVGGETHLVTVPRDISYADLLSKVSELSGLSPTLKYQLPDQELDTLVSVSSDEDLDNMMEEYDKIEAGEGSSRLRVFLFTAADYDMTSLGEQLGYFKDSEQRYVDAVNGLLETGSRKQSEGAGSSGAPPVENLLDVDGPWLKDTVKEAVPMALLAPQVSQDVASLMVHVPVAVPVALPVASLATSSYQSIPPAISAPLSAPSSPPSTALSGLMAPPVVPDLLFQEPVGKSGHLYTGLVPSDSSYKDQDGYVSSAVSSSTSVHDAHFRGVETRRAPESPPKPQMMPRAGSHGQLLDHERGGRLEHIDGFPLPDLQRLVLHQQQQPRQHAVDLQAESYRRADLLPHDAVPPAHQQTPAFGPSTQTAVHFRPAPPGQDALFWQMEQAQLQPQTQQQLPPQHGEDIYGLHHMQRSISAHALLHSGPGVGTGAPYQGPSGSAPTSPRPSYRDVPGRLLGGQPQLLHRHYAHADGKYGRRVHAYAEPPSRPLPASPPRHRDREYVPPVDERVMRQQQLPPVAATILSTEAVPHDPLTGAVIHQYETSTVSQGLYSDVLPRSSVAQYVVLNPYQDGLLSYQDHQDSGEARRHVLTPGMEHSGVVHSQSHYKVPIANHKQFVHPPEQHSRLPDVDWRVHDSDDRLRAAGGRAWVGQPNYLDGNLGMDLGASQSAPSSFSGFHFPEDSDAVLSQEPYVSPPVWNARGEESVTSAQGRSVALPTVALPGFINFRGAAVDGAQSHSPYYAKPVDNEHKVTAAMAKSLLGLQDMSANSSQVSSSHGVLPAKAQPLLDEQVAPVPFTQLAPGLVKAEVAAGPTVVNLVNEPWQAASPAEEVFTGHLPLVLDEHDLKVPNLFGNELAGRLVPHIGPVGLDDGLEDRTRAAELSSVFTQANGSLQDDRLTSTYALDGLSLVDETLASIPTASPVGFTNVSPLVSGQASVTSAGGDRPTHAPRSQSVYKPSPLGVQSIGVDPYSGVDKFTMLQDGQTTQPVTGEGSTKNDPHRSGAAHLAEDVAASVLASRGAPVSDKSSLLMENFEAATTVGDPTPAATGSRLTPASIADKPPLDGGEVRPAQGPSDAGVAAASESGFPAQLNPREVLEDLKIPDVVEEIDHGSSPPEEDNAAKAKREAIARGLQTIHNEDLEELRELGSGTFGTVYHGKWRGSDVAIKRIKASCFAGRPSEQERLRADFWREACTLSQLHHPNVVAFYGVVPDGPGGTLATVTEYMVNGSMKQVMQKKDRTIDRRKRLLIAMDAAFGMEYLHSKNIVHFDLKCENLLVNMRDPQRPICKVGDLGLSKVKHQTMVSGGVRGTLPWMAPELLNGRTSMVTDKVDVYSFGIVMWELLTGEEPYASMHYGAIIGGIVNDSLRPDIPHWCEPAWRNLMERCWAADPAARPSFSDIASELRTMSAAPKAQGLSQPHTHMQGQGQTAGQVQGQNSPPRAHGGSPPRLQGQVSPPQRQGKMSPPRAV